MSPEANLWKHVMEHAAWGVAISGLDGRLASVSRDFARMHGRAAEELIGTPISDVFGPAHRADLLDRIAQIHALDSLHWESVHVRADGSTFPVAIDATAVRNAAGVIVSRAFFVQDITDQKREEYSFRALFEQAPDGIFIAEGLSGPYLDVNPAACQLLGYSREQLLGKTRAELVAPEDVAHGEAARERALQGQPVLGEWRLRRADGSWVMTEVNGKLLPDGRWQNFVRDISQRKQVEESLAASEEKFRRIVSVAAEAIILVDEQQHILLFNEGAERIFGWSAQEMLGSSLDRLLPERYRASHRVQMTRFAKSGDSAREMSPLRRVCGLRRNGKEFPARASISAMVIHGQSVLAVVLRDVSREEGVLEREKFLNELGGVLASSLDAEQTLGELTRRVVRRFADLCVVDLVQLEGPRRPHVAAREPKQPWFAEALRSFPLEPALPQLEERVWRTQAPELVEVTHAYLTEHSQGPAHLALLKAMQARSLLSVPMIARGQMSGILIAISCERMYDQQDEKLLMQVAERAAMAIENASLHNSLRQAHVDARARLAELQQAHEKIQTLTGLLPVCAWCGRIRDEQEGGLWKRLDQYMLERGAADVSHGICPDCESKHFPSHGVSR